MPRLIDADVLAKWLDKEHYVDRPSGKCDERQNRVLGIAISALKNPQIAPAIDAEPVRHGRWEWLNDEDGGSRADLRDADLRGADLSRADLRGADLSRADLSVIVKLEILADRRCSSR